MLSGRFLAALQRTLAEVQKARLSHITLLGFKDAQPLTSHFLQVCYGALYDAYVGHAIRVFERGRVASFWYLYRCHQGRIDELAGAHGVDLKRLEAVSDRLKIIRDGTQFHIDKDAVQEPAAVWRAAGVVADDLIYALDSIWSVLNELQQEVDISRSVCIPVTYDRSYVARIVAGVERLDC